MREMDLSYWLHLRTVDSKPCGCWTVDIPQQGHVFYFQSSVDSYPATYNVLTLKTVKSFSEVVHT